MYTKFSPAGSNTGSSSTLANYLDKEQANGWFDHEKDAIKSEEVVQKIDQNGKGQLGKDDWKFVEVEYNPSHREQQKIVEVATGKKGVDSLGELSAKEREAVKDEFRQYVRAAQDSQAKNYNRENINSGADLKYYAKIETQRKYKGTDEAVKDGKVKQGDLKKGLNMHVHIIQSRKGADRKTKLSPLSQHRKQTHKNKIQQGFDRNRFAKQIEKDFDKKFSYNRDVKETLEYKKANKSNDYNLKQSLMEEAKDKIQSPEMDYSQISGTREKKKQEHNWTEQGVKDTERDYGSRVDSKDTEKEFDSRSTERDYGYRADLKDPGKELDSKGSERDYGYRADLKAPEKSESELRDSRETFIRESREKEQELAQGKELEKDNRKEMDKAIDRDQDREQGYSY